MLDVAPKENDEVFVAGAVRRPASALFVVPGVAKENNVGGVILLVTGVEKENGWPTWQYQRMHSNLGEIDLLRTYWWVCRTCCRYRGRSCEAKHANEKWRCGMCSRDRRDDEFSVPSRPVPPCFLIFRSRPVAGQDGTGRDGKKLPSHRSLVWWPASSQSSSSPLCLWHPSSPTGYPGYPYRLIPENLL